MLNRRLQVIGNRLQIAPPLTVSAALLGSG
jgi:hypothetical protein